MSDPEGHTAAGSPGADAEPKADDHEGAGDTRPDGTTSPHAFWTGRSALVMPAILAAFSLFLLIGSAQIDAADAEFPGPRFVPMILGAIGLLLAVLLAIGLLQRPEPVTETSGRRYRTYSDFAALGWVAGGFLAFALLLPWLGWILAAALLFWTAAHGFGSRRPLFDILVALFLSSATYLIFGTGLGLTLPSGILGGGF